MKQSLSGFVLSAFLLTTALSMSLAPSSMHAFPGHHDRSQVDHSEMTNSISNVPEPSSAHSNPNIGDTLMEEFLTFLTLKDTGLLDLCMEVKR